MPGPTGTALLFSWLGLGRFGVKAGSPFLCQWAEVTASWGEARLIKYLDGKLVLKGGSKEDRMAAREWISMFLSGAVVREG